MFSKVWGAINERDVVVYKSTDLQKVRAYVKGRTDLTICIVCNGTYGKFLWKSVNV